MGRVWIYSGAPPFFKFQIRGKKTQLDQDYFTVSKIYRIRSSLFAA